MSEQSQDLDSLLGALRPVLHPGVYVFCVAPQGLWLEGVPMVAMFREDEGTTLIVEETFARDQQLTPLLRAAWITLTVNSDLRAVGLTAAVSSALANAGIACNVIAAAHHDHLFVPEERRSDALKVLKGLSGQQAGGT
jgi:hypothetical protein